MSATGEHMVWIRAENGWVNAAHVVWIWDDQDTTDLREPARWVVKFRTIDQLHHRLPNVYDSPKAAEEAASDLADTISRGLLDGRR
jgi:hypothetical protein